MSAPVIEWTPQRREVLDRALRKVQAGREQREMIAMTGAEAAALSIAAENWRDMMLHLDAAAEQGKLSIAPPRRIGNPDLGDPI